MLLCGVTTCCTGEALPSRLRDEAQHTPARREGRTRSMQRVSSSRSRVFVGLEARGVIA